MKKKTFRLINILLIASFLLVACNDSTNPTEPLIDPTVEENTPTASVAQPTEAVPTSVVVSENELDLTFQKVLDDMVSYNAIGVDTLHQWLNEEPPPFLLDVRFIPEVEELGRIEGSVVIPLRDLAKAESIALLPSYDTKIVAYCGSGWRCTIAMMVLGALGWTDVQTLEEGSYGGWMNAGYPILTDLPEVVPLNVAQPDPSMQAQMDNMLNTFPEGFGGVPSDILHQAILNVPELMIIDVRRGEEIIEKGGIENAIHIPLESIILSKEKWPSSKEAMVMVYSDKGHRSTIAMTILRTYGYAGVASLLGGFNGWVDAGLPVAEVAVSE
jgi:rhodanese-related sulfurtransferase